MEAQTSDVESGIEWHDMTPDEYAEARRYSMELNWEPDDEIYIVSVPELPGLLTHGTTHQEAVEAGEEVIALWLYAMRGRGSPIPQPRFFDYDLQQPRVAVRDVDIAPPPAFGAERVLALRRRLGVSQRVFAAALNASIGAVRAWEYGRRVPDGPTVRLLELVERQPDLLFGANPAPQTGQAADLTPAPVRIAG